MNEFRPAASAVGSLCFADEEHKNQMQLTTVDPPQSPTDSAGWWTLLCLLAAVGVFFGPVIFADRSFLFRDVAHFYAPLWEWARGEWGQGRVPLWNPLQNLGVPHLAENTSSVFYPGKALFALPGEFNRLFNVFLAGHVLVAGYTMFRLLRNWGQSPTAGSIAAISYALSGGVLFQYCNPPFLIGAAWLPAAVAAAAALLKHRSIANAARVAMVLAIMMLGGDAQSVYHVGLMMMLLAFLHWRDGLKLPVVPLGVAIRSENRGWANGLKWIACAAAICLGLTAVQILPTSQYTAQSVRATYEFPRSLDELAVDAINRKPLQTEGLLSKSKPNSHHQRVFDFSVGPWRWAELVWPNVSGRWFPINARWIKTIPAEGKVWTPSLYLGLIPIWLACGALRNRRRLSIEGRWIGVCTWLAILGSMGAYGIGWLVVDWHIHNGGVEATAPVGRNFGGLYWLMTVALPFYVKFRYPAKLWTIATFGFSVLAGMEWDRRQSTGRRRIRWLWAAAIFSLLAIVAVYALQTPLKQAWSDALFADSVFGPLDVERAWLDVVWALGQTVFISLAVGIVLSARSTRTSKWAGAFIALLITADLVTAHHWMLPSAPTSELGQAPVVAKTDALYPNRIYRSPPVGWRLEAWRTSSSPDRLHELVRRDRETLYPQHHLATGQSVLGATTTIPNRDWSSTVTELRTKEDGWQERLANLGVDCLVTDSAEGFVTQSLAPRPRVWAVDVDNGNKAEDAECSIVSYSPQKVVVTANVSGPAVIVLSEQYHPDWRVLIGEPLQKMLRPAPLLKMDGVLRGVRLDKAGEYTIRYEFNSQAFRWGAAMSAVTWALVLLGLAVGWLRTRRQM